MKKQRFITGLLVMSMIVSMFSLMPARNVKGAEINAVTATMEPADLTEICKVDTPITKPVLTTTSSGSAEVVSDSADWRRNGADVIAESFSDGSWTLWVPVVIDVAESPEHYFSASVSLTVNGTAWTLDHISDTKDVAWFHSPEINLTGSQNLSFIKETNWDIGETAVGVPITPFSVKSGVSGGTGSYWFTITDGPFWLTINHTTGEISGTPTNFGGNTSLEIKVDDGQNTASISLKVSYTKINDHEGIYDVDANCPAFPTEIKVGDKAETLTFTDFSPSAVSASASNSYWEQYDAAADSWAKIENGTEFAAGSLYRYRVEITADPTTYCFAKVDFFVNEYLWDRLGEIDHAGCKASFVSDPISISIESATIVGVPYPIVGKVPSIDGIIVHEEEILLNDAWWERQTDSEWETMESDETFEAGKNYRIHLKLDAAPPYSIAGAVKATVNGLGSSHVTIVSCDGEALELTCPIPFAEYSSSLYVVTAGALNVREAASYNAGRVSGLKYGDVVLATQESSGWVKIDHEEENAWVKKDYLALTYTYDTAIKPEKYTVNAGALNVRSGPFIPADESGNRIGSYTAGKEILVTGRVVGLDSEVWLVVDYNGQLGFIMAKYATGETVTVESAEEDEPEEELIVHTGGVPAKVTISLKSAAIAHGTQVDLTEENASGIGDGYATIVIYPDDAKNFDTLTVDKISIPATDRYVIVEFAKQEDGSIQLKLGPKDPVTLTFESSGGSSVVSLTVSKGETAEEPDTPVKAGYVFGGWFTDAALSQAYDFSAPVTADQTVYAKWEPIEYTISAGGDGTWEKGSTNAVEITVNRSVDDETTYSHFTGLDLDGTLVDTDGYTASSGSLHVEINPSFLETLTVGSHTLEVFFDDGSATTSLVIAEASKTEESSADSEVEESSADSQVEESSTDSQVEESSMESTPRIEESSMESEPQVEESKVPDESSKPEPESSAAESANSQQSTPPSSNNNTAKDKNPNTGDHTRPVLWTLFLLISAVGITVLVKIKKKSLR